MYQYIAICPIRCYDLNMAEEQKKSVTISFVTTPKIEDALREAAEKQERSLSWIIGKALEEFLTKLGTLKKPSDR